jgi:ligand-binding sensor domain-containing protein
MPDRKLLVLIFFAFGIKLNAQNLPFREYGVQDGLAQSQAAVIYQDSRGFLWIPTRNGLSRFDGLEFVNYFRKDGLPANFVSSVFEDNNGKIWTLTVEGLSLYTGDGFKFFNQDIHSEKALFGYESVIDGSNNFYLLSSSSESGFSIILKFKDGVYSSYSALYPPLDTLKIRNIAFDQENNELLIFDVRSQLWSWKNERLRKLSSEKYDYMSHDHEKIFLARGETLFDYRNGKITLRQANRKKGISEVVQNNASSNTVDFFDGNSSIRIQKPFTSASYEVDNEGNMWVSSENNIKKLLSTAFSYYTEDDLSIKNTWAIAADRNGNMWFGSLFGKLVEFDGVTFRERNEYKKLFKRPVAFYKGSRKLSNGDEWFSTSDGVLIWDGSSFSRLNDIPEYTQICYIYEDPDNKVVMLGTDRGLFILNHGKVTCLSEYTDSNLGVIEGITKDNEGVYWLSGHNGLVRFNGVSSVALKEDVLPIGYTYTIEKDYFGGIWVTSEEGLFTRSKPNENFIAGLPDAVNKSANSITVMDRKHILIGRISDICIIDLEKFYRNEKNYFRIYDKTDGFTGNDCIDNGIIKDRNGHYWILTADKIVIFDPSKLKINPVPPSMHITGFYYETDSLYWKPVENGSFFYDIPENLSLSRQQNKLQITFTGISLTNPEKVKFQYRLDGFDDKWSALLEKRFVIYEKLPPGNYTFQVKAANADGIVNTEPLVFKFRIIPAFWQTILFKITISLILLTAVTAIPFRILKRIQNKRNEREKLKAELSHLQMSSIVKQFDPHFTFNVISSVGSLIMKGEKETAYEYITKLSGLLRTALSDGSLIIKPLAVELDFVRKYCDLQKLRFRGRFNYNISIDENIDLQREIPKMIIQTFVENSIKHGFENRKEGGRVEIQVRLSDKDLEIHVIDNGIGRLAASRINSSGTGNGLKIIAGLFEVMNNYNARKSELEIIDLRNEEGYCGTEVKITIPENYRFEFLPR